MNNIRDKFEAWFTGEVDSKTRRAMMEKDDAGYYKFQSAYNAWNVWQAATEQSQKEIAELTADYTKALEFGMTRDVKYREFKAQCEALQAREKELVEALERILETGLLEGSYDLHTKADKIAREALANVRGEVK